jgi:hypothetical protein
MDDVHDKRCNKIYSTFIKIGWLRIGVSRYRNIGGRRIDEEKRMPGLAFESGKKNLEFPASVSEENLGFASMASRVEVELGGINDGNLDFTGRNSIDHVRILLLRENNQDRIGLQHQHLAGVQVEVERRCTNFRFYTNSPRQYHHPIFTSSYNITNAASARERTRATGCWSGTSPWPHSRTPSGQGRGRTEELEDRARSGARAPR